MLPTREQWRFDEIAAEEPSRVSSLESLRTPAKILDSLTEALHDGLSAGTFRLGRELAEDARGGYRAVLQFQAGTMLFDWFFNGRCGYRAHYWSAPIHGIEFNNQIIACVREHIISKLPDRLPACDIRQRFELAAAVVLRREFFARSFAPTLSKIWWCARRLDSGCRVEQLAPGLAGPRLVVDGPRRWAAPYRTESDAWLDAYGAFVSDDLLYQPKDPFVRAEKLHADGEA